MTDERSQVKRGRPQGSATGQTPLRTAKIGAEWTRGQDLDRRLAELDGAKPNMTTYVETALREHNARVERLIAKRRAAAD